MDGHSKSGWGGHNGWLFAMVIVGMLPAGLLWGEAARANDYGLLTFGLNGGGVGCTSDACGGCSSGCDIDLDAACCEPRWTVLADVVFMQRARPDSRVLMQASGNPATYNAEEFRFDYETGWQLAGIWHGPCGWDVEARWLTLDGWTAGPAVQVDTDLQDPLRINTNPPTFVPNVDQVVGVFNSELLSLELNVKRRRQTLLAPLVGLRYLELDDRLAFDLVGSNPAAVYGVTTQNRLFGGQVGAEAVLVDIGCFRVEGVGKAGLYHNSAAHRSVLDNGVVAQPAAQRHERVAFVGELGVWGRLQATDWLAVRGGYSALWIEGAALGDHQIPATDLFNGTGIAANGGVLYHSVLVGVEAAW